MDAKVAGSFMAEQRKSLGMTQRELAELIGVSDKTISKWECGNSIPDISYMQSLCESLGISMNEFLAGEKLSAEAYSTKAEENIMELMKENEQTKKFGWKSALIGVVLLVGFVVMYFCFTAGGDRAGVVMETKFLDWPSALMLVFLAFAEVIAAGVKGKLEVLKFLRKVIFSNGLLIFVADAIVIMSEVTNLKQLGPNFSVSLLALVYSAIFYIAVTILEKRWSSAK